MKRPFFRSLSGKFIVRSTVLTLLVALPIAVLAILKLRSLASTADELVAGAQGESDEAVASLEALADSVSSSSSSLMLTLIIALVVGLIVVGGLAFLAARKLVTPLVGLRTAVAQSQAALPEMVEAGLADEAALSDMPKIILESGDEVEDLADSINQLQFNAARLSVSHARGGQHGTGQFVELGQRTQRQLAAQMHLIEAMEKDEANPENLERLFQLDHLATQIRRSADSLLVLAEQASPRVLDRPVLLHQVVQAAASEVEHFDKITMAEVSGSAIDGSVAPALAHLLAELLEDATDSASSAPPATVSGRPSETGYLIEVVDHTDGIAADELAAINTHFANPAASSAAYQASLSLGHTVAARIAQRYQIGVELSATPTGGVTARVHVPQSLLVQANQVPTPAQAAFSAVTKTTETEPTVVSTPTGPPPAAVVEAAPAAAAPVAVVSEPTTPAPTAPPSETFEPAVAPAAAAPAAPAATDGLTEDQNSAIDFALQHLDGFVQAGPVTAPGAVPAAGAGPVAGVETALRAGPVSPEAVAQRAPVAAEAGVAGPVTDHQVDA